MLIRSQNKKALVNLNNIEIICTHETDIVCHIGEKYINIAHYSNEEKAIKVLDMLENAYLDYCCNYHNQSAVFQIPLDDEIE